jgi:aerobic carbon-monoxide dehydrogenase large subunit
VKTVNSYIGAPLKRFEDFRFLTGRGQFVGDLKRERLLHAVILRSPVAHGTISAIDTSRARAMPGAHAIITAADVGANVPRIPMR